MSPTQELGEYLKELREGRGMSLRDAERATDGYVSNAYLSQLELGKRVEPGPKVLTALAKAYGVEVQLLFERAGYVDAPAPSEVEIAFEQVRADEEFKYGTRLSSDLDESAKRVIVELYERVTKKKLLPTRRVEDGQDRSRAKKH